MVLEKVKWDIGGWSCELFVLLTPVYFVVLVYLNAVKHKTIRIAGLEKKVLIYYYLLQLGYLLFQFLVIKKDSTITTQYIKGIITTVVQFVAVLNLVLMYRYYRNRITFEYVCKLFLVIANINAVYCLIQVINPNIDNIIVSLLNSTVSRYGLDSYGQLKRVTGLLLEPNFNGPFLVIALVISVYRYTNLPRIGKRKEKRYLLASIVLMGLMCLMTLSLTAYIGLVTWFVLFIHNSGFKHKRMIIGIVLAGIVAVIFVIVTNQSVYNAIVAKLSFTASLKSLRENSHVRILRESFEIYFSDLRIILFGTGLNCLNVYFQRMFGYEIMKAHNYFVQYLCEVGIAGWGIYLMYFRLLYKYAGNTTAGKLVKLLVICTIMMNFTYDPFTRYYNFLILFMAFVNYRDSQKLNAVC